MLDRVTLSYGEACDSVVLMALDHRARDRLSAKRVLELISKNPTGSRKPTWAEIGKMSTMDAAVKRQRSTESDASGAKKQRISDYTNIFYNEVLKDSIKMAVVDRANPFDSITPANWRFGHIILKVNKKDSRLMEHDDSALPGETSLDEYVGEEDDHPATSLQGFLIP